MSQSAALLAARASSGSAATCSGRGITSQLAIPRAHLASAPLQSQSRALAAAGRRHALRTGTSGEGARLRQNTALPMSHPSGWGQQHCSLRNSAAPPRAMGNYEDEEEDEEEEMDTLDEDDIVPGAFLPSIATLLLRCCLFSTSVGGGGGKYRCQKFSNRLRNFVLVRSFSAYGCAHTLPNRHSSGFTISGNTSAIPDSE